MEVIPGNAAAADPNLPFAGLNQFGANFLSRFECAQLDVPTCVNPNSEVGQISSYLPKFLLASSRLYPKFFFREFQSTSIDFRDMTAFPGKSMKFRETVLVTIRQESTPT